MSSAEIKIQTFKSQKSFRSWLVKNHNKKTEIWIQFYKKGYDFGGVSFSDAIDVSLCFGWHASAIRRLDVESYKALFYKRKPKSQWSKKVMDRYKGLKKLDLVQPSGEAAFKERDKENSGIESKPLPEDIIRRFKKHKKAWEFYQSCNPGYHKSVSSWILQGKRQETREKRFKELLQDSADGTKLKRFLEAIEKYKPRYEKGKTPIEVAKNIGTVTGAELRSVGYDTVEKLIGDGWEEAFEKLISVHYHRFTLSTLVSIIGAVEGQSKKDLDSSLKVEAKQHIRLLARCREE